MNAIVLHYSLFMHTFEHFGGDESVLMPIFLLHIHTHTRTLPSARVSSLAGVAVLDKVVQAYNSSQTHYLQYLAFASTWPSSLAFHRGCNGKPIHAFWFEQRPVNQKGGRAKTEGRFPETKMICRRSVEALLSVTMRWGVTLWAAAGWLNVWNVNCLIRKQYMKERRTHGSVEFSLDSRDLFPIPA